MVYHCGNPQHEMLWAMRRSLCLAKSFHRHNSQLHTSDRKYETRFGRKKCMENTGNVLGNWQIELFLDMVTVNNVFIMACDVL